MDSTVPSIKEVQDFKFFSWETYPTRKKEPDEWQTFLKRTKLDSSPGCITDIQELYKKLSEENSKLGVISDQPPRKNQRVTFWEWPHTVPPAIACHVAKERGCALNDVNFLVHGSVLGYLARVRTKSNKEHILVQRLGGENIINVRVVINSNGNLMDAGRQFEKLVRGESVFSKPSLRQDLHLRTIELGPYKILVCAETDAIDAVTGKQVEVKTKNPLTEKSYDRDIAKLLFQMMSNGSDTLVTAKRNMEEDKKQTNIEGQTKKQGAKKPKSSFKVEFVNKIPLSFIIEKLSEGEATLGRKIATAQSSLQFIQQAILVGDDKCYEVVLQQDKIDIQPFVPESQAKSSSLLSQASLCKSTQNEFQQKNSEYYSQHVMGHPPIKRNPSFKRTQSNESARVKEGFKIDRGKK